MSSVLEADRLRALYDEVRAIYRADARPWVLGFSGGKDSTCALQVVWTALAGLRAEERTKPVFVISSDTLVETPVIIRYIDATLDRITAEARRQGLPIEAHKVVPDVDRSFWVNLIGRGYPAPSRRFRWCTERLKIEPANEFIKERVAEFGEVVMVLGVRSSESATRAQVMSFHRIKGSRLARHSSLLNAFVYAPVEAFTTDQVWSYLLQNPSPWGNDNRDLVALYRNAAGECPLVVDTTTPSCGNSRFGCWVCTVVERDRAMEAMIDKGEEWLEPLLEYRDMLASTQEPTRKSEFRDFKRRTGQVSFKADSDDPIPGPYKFEFCKELLRKLLQTQMEVAELAPDGEKPVLIHEAELHEIRRIWRAERGDWHDSVPAIVRETLGVELSWLRDEGIEGGAAFGGEEADLLDEVSRDHDVPAALLRSLIDIERAAHGLKRRHGVHTRIEEVMRQEWRDLDRIVADRRAGRSRVTEFHENNAEVKSENQPSLLDLVDEEEVGR